MFCVLRAGNSKKPEQDMHVVTTTLLKPTSIGDAHVTQQAMGLLQILVNVIRNSINYK